MIMATKMQDGLAWLEIGPFNKSLRHLLRLIVDPSCASKGEVAPREARGNVGVQSERARIGVLCQ